MAVDVENSPLFQQRKAHGLVVVKELPKIDLETYMANYQGILRIERLATIARTSTLLSIDAFRLAISEAHAGQNLQLYHQLQAEFQKVSPNDELAQPDMPWAAQVDRKNRTQTERLELELKGYKNNLIKESIRMGNEDIGNHYFAIGNLAEAHKAYTRMRESCTLPVHIANMTLKQLYVAIAQKSWSTAGSYSSKVSQLNMNPEQKGDYTPILQACTGLAQMCDGRYRDAAGSFLAVNASYMTLGPQSGIAFQSQVITPNDVAIYGGLCALATMDRTDLENRVLENSEFRQFLELEPHIRRMITLFCSSKYSACLSKLQQYTADYLLDMNLQPHFLKLVKLIRSKAIVQWFSTFSVVTFDELERAFPPVVPGANIEDEMAIMIRDGLLNARIDSVDRLLVYPDPDLRLTVIEDALKVAREAEKTLLLRLHKINMQSAGLEIRNVKAGGAGHHGAQYNPASGGEHEGGRGLRNLMRKGGALLS